MCAATEQKLMADSLPAEGACVKSMIDMGPNESLLILMKHCQDMKQQETRLRLITLLLLLSCVTLLLFIDFRRQNNSASSGEGSTVAPRPAYSRQERVCPTDPPNHDPSTTFQRLHIHLRSVPAKHIGDEHYIQWHVEFGEKNVVSAKNAIVIPQTGFYFVYLRIALICPSEHGAADFLRFYVELHSWNKGYNKTVKLTEAWDGVSCSPRGVTRNVFLGQLFDLLEGDHVRVWIKEGYKLITKSTFGTYLT